MYPTLRYVCLLYVLPVGFVLIQLTVRNGYLQTSDLWQMNFSLTGITRWLVALLAAVWLVLSVRHLIDYRRNSRHWRELLRQSIPEDRKDIWDEFERVKRKLKIHRNIRLYRTGGLPGPMIVGILSPRILIPDVEYSREQFTVIFYHELTHYRNFDLFYKLCGFCVGMIQHLNIVSDRLLESLDEWSECECDRKAITAMSSEMTAGRYFELIMEIKRNTPETPGEDYIFSMLCESQLRLERRIDYMRRYGEIKRVAKGVTAAMAFAFVMFSVTTAYAAGTELAAAHDYVYKKAEEVDVMQMETKASEGLIPFYLSASEDDSYKEIVYDEETIGLIMPLLAENEVTTFNWTVDPGVRHVSSKISLKKGQKISISCSSAPSTVTYWLGIMAGDGHVTCVEGNGSMAYTFEIKDSSSYRVLVQNRGSSTLTAGGSYYYYTP